MSGFFIYPTVGIIIASIYWLKFFKLIPQQYFYISNSISIIFHFCFLTQFINKVTNHKNTKRLINPLYVLFLIILILLVNVDIRERSNISFSVANFGICYYCIRYYHCLLQLPDKFNILEQSSFWAVTGIFFGMSMTIPACIFNLYLFKNTTSDIYLTLALIPTFSYGVMHLFFIKSFLCLAPVQRQS